MNITVYCGAAAGTDPAFAREARRLGDWMAARGHTLVWGGGGTGLMGEVSRAVLDGGGAAVGVIPDFLMELETPPAGFTNYQVTATMTERRTRMIELGDAFVALPGGPGTLEEVSEIVSLIKLGRLDAPCVLVSVNGYFDGLAAVYDSMVTSGFVARSVRDRLLVVSSVDELAELLAE